MASSLSSPQSLLEVHDMLPAVMDSLVIVARALGKMGQPPAIPIPRTPDDNSVFFQSVTEGVISPGRVFARQARITLLAALPAEKRRLTNGTRFESEGLGMVTVREALPEDAEGIAELYDSVEVTPTNVHLYETSGGFFNPLNPEVIRERILSIKRYNIVVVSADRRVLGYCTGSYDVRDELSDLRFSDPQEQKRFDDLFQDKSSKVNVGALLDVVTAPRYNAGGLATLMEYQAILQLRAFHVHEMAFEIYNPLLMLPEEEFKPFSRKGIDFSSADVLDELMQSKNTITLHKRNIPSIAFHERMGAKNIGAKFIPVIKNGIVYIVEASLFSFRGISKNLRTFPDRVDEIMDGEECLIDNQRLENR